MVTFTKENRRIKERKLIEEELNKFWKEKDNYLIIIITNKDGTKRLCYNYETANQIVSTLVAAQMAEMGMYEKPNS